MIKCLFTVHRWLCVVGARGGGVRGPSGSGGHLLQPWGDGGGTGCWIHRWWRRGSWLRPQPSPQITVTWAMSPAFSGPQHLHV